VYSSCATSTALLLKLAYHIRSHSITFHPAEVTFQPPLPQPIKGSTRFSNPRGMQGWVDLVGLVTYVVCRPITMYVIVTWNVLCYVFCFTCFCSAFRLLCSVVHIEIDVHWIFVTMPNIMWWIFAVVHLVHVLELPYYHYSRVWTGSLLLLSGITQSPNFDNILDVVM